MATDTKVINLYARYGVGILLSFAAVAAGMETYAENDPWDLFACACFLFGAGMNFWMATQYNKLK